ncbi:cytosine permease [Ornithinibacillus halotolerans]|uniref:Allantoin permease n=1 Tax=Ornithinibacillus halotolerans TaxID=1274357 RepID=A0A916W503_9BACI|nr:cytosine permease [Ornithinibacillus halotolerans]GGA66014.1 hypothetical protein GCM10008025_07280 [Ornithinibacillus halotolerans]
MEQINREELLKAGYSEDVLPTQPADKTWNIANFFSVWMGSVHNIPNYLAIGGLFALGMSVGQVFSSIMIAAILISIVMVLNGHAGAKYGIPRKKRLT